MLVDLECAQYVSFYVRTRSGEPHAQIGRPKVAKTLPKALPAGSNATAIILTALLAGLRSDELINANVGDDVRRTDDGAVVHVRGKGGKDRRIPVEAPLVEVLDSYLDTRVARFPAAAKRRSPTAGLAAWPPPRRCSLAPAETESPAAQCNTGSCVPSAAQGIDSERAEGALVHGLRHTFSTELANSDVL